MFWTDEESDIEHQFAYFTIKDVEYVIDFSADDDILRAVYDIDPIIPKVTSNNASYTVKFAVRKYYEGDEGKYLFSPPDEHNFKKQDIVQLKQTLENLIQKHCQTYKAECYCFLAERDSLNRMYKKMCENSDLLLEGFKPICCLGKEQKCFIIKTPLYKEK